MVVLSCSMNGVTSWHKIRAGARGLRYNGGGFPYGVIVRDELFWGATVRGFPYGAIVRDELFWGNNGGGFTYRVIRSGMRCLLR
jgi:hypothetical protein